MSEVEEEIQTTDEVAQAQQVLKAKEQEMINAFMQDYQELSKKHGLGLSPVLTIRANGVEPNLEVVKV